MPFSIQVRTTAGLSDLSNIDSVRVKWKARRTTTTGSVTVPVGINNSDIAFADVNDGGMPPNLIVSSADNTITWTQGNANSTRDPSSDFVIMLVE